MNAGQSLITNLLTLVLVVVVIFFVVGVNLSFEGKPWFLKDTQAVVMQDILAEEDKSVVENEPEETLPFYPGERLTYGVKLKEMRIGSAVLTFLGETDLDGRPAYFITFDTFTPYFRDSEKIYASKENFLPLRVSREIKRKVGFSTEIDEEYDQKEYKVKIRKKGILGTKTFTIDKSSEIHNAITVSYYYRTGQGFKENQKFSINLPTKELELVFKGKEKVSTHFGQCRAYIFEGNPSSFKLWLKDDKNRTPLRIEDSNVFGYSLVLESVEQLEIDDVGSGIEEDR
ncbi:MAG: DUF3108 domain-containing protein [Candidatus Omnitrophica bacterium]|nr:DUF3108 domain-containing protein [Candidatus Omnitrophota bacterium]